MTVRQPKDIPSPEKPLSINIQRAPHQRPALQKVSWWLLFVNDNDLFFGGDKD
jgi:hypothetical protein